MVMTPLTLTFLGVLALVASLGLFYRFGDPYTGVLVSFTAAVLWAIFALASRGVMVYDAPPAEAARSMDPLMWVGVALAVLTGLFAVSDLFQALGSEAQSTDPEDIAGRF